MSRDALRDETRAGRKLLGLPSLPRVLEVTRQEDIIGA